jgi:hypothetical protein
VRMGDGGFWMLCRLSEKGVPRGFCVLWAFVYEDAISPETHDRRERVGIGVVV